MCNAICTAATSDWVDKHLVRWRRYMEKYNPDWDCYLYHIGQDFEGQFPGFSEKFVKVIELDPDGRRLFNRCRMSATTHFDVPQIVWMDCDCDVIGSLDDMTDGLHPKATLACVQSPAMHKDWRVVAEKHGFDDGVEYNNGLLWMSEDWGERYDVAFKAMEGEASPRIEGTIAFNAMLATNDGWGEIDYKYSTIWWDVASFVGARAIQYCNDKGQAKRVMLEEEYRDSVKVAQ